MQKRLFNMNILIFSIIILIYTVIIILSVSYFNYKNYSQKVVYDNETSLVSAANQIDKWTENVFQFSAALSSTQSVETYLQGEQSSYVYFPAIYDDLINSQQLNFQSNVQIGLTKSSDELLVSHNGYLTTSEYLSTLNIDEELYQTALKTNSNELYTYSIVPHTVNEIRYTTIIEKRAFPEHSETLMTFITFPNKEIIGSSLSAKTNMYYSYDNDLYSLTAETDNLDQNLLQLQNYSESNKNELHTTYTDELVASSFPLEFLSGVSLVQTYSINLFDFIIESYIRQILSFLLILFVLGLILSIFSIRKVYEPIQNIISMLTSKTDTVSEPAFTHGNELTYIRQNIDKLYSENKELKQSQSDSIRTRQAEFLIEQLSQTEPQSADHLQDRLEKLNLTGLKEGGTLSILSVEGMTIEEVYFSKDNLLTYRSKLLNMIKRNNQDQFSIVVPLDFKHFCLFFSDKNRETIETSIHDMIPVIEQELSTHITFAVSSPVESIKQFSTAFNEVSTILNEKDRYTNRQLIFPDTALIATEKSTYTLEEERHLINAVLNNDLLKADGMVQAILSRLFEGPLNSATLSEYKILLLNTVKRLLAQNNLSIKLFQKENRPLFDALKTTSGQELYSAFTNLFNQVFAQCIFSSSDITDPTTLKIIEYIHAHYQEDLSLTDLANKFSLSENYISRLLKKNAHFNFKTYITELKIQKSKELLRTELYTINEISSMVGYNHANTFIRTFKKHEGYSPGEYSKIQC